VEFETFFDLYESLSKSLEVDSDVRKNNSEARKKSYEINSLIKNASFDKEAFDTRRIDQETTVNPRRGLQNYHRSAPFVSQDMKRKITAFTKLFNVLKNIKDVYGREEEFQDSYVRVLHSSVKKALRLKQGDNDFSDSQASVGSLEYLDQLIYVRYRLTAESLLTMAEEEISEVLLAKDELLMNLDMSDSLKEASSEYDQNKKYTNDREPALRTRSDSTYEVVKPSQSASENAKTVTININV
jgi:hypothetical protein